MVEQSRPKRLARPRGALESVGMLMHECPPSCAYLLSHIHFLGRTPPIVNEHTALVVVSTHIHGTHLA